MHKPSIVLPLPLSTRTQEDRAAVLSPISGGGPVGEHVGEITSAQHVQPSSTGPGG